MEKVEYVEFSIVGEIKTKQRPRAAMIRGHARIYTPKDTILYENYIKAMYQEKYKDFNFGNKPISLTVKCYFKANQVMEKFASTEVNEIPCKTHKDLDNIAKTIMDALNGIAFYDDKQITELRAFKEYTKDNERIEVIIQSTEEQYLYSSLEHLKDKKKYYELNTKIQELLSKPKLNKADSERLEKFKTQSTELGKKIEANKYND